MFYGDHPAESDSTATEKEMYDALRRNDEYYVEYPFQPYGPVWEYNV